MNIRDICIAALMTTAIATANGNAMAGNIKTYRSGPVNITVEEPEIPALSVSITDFGAKGDGLTLCTDACAKAIASLSERGGGTLRVPHGVWLTGPIVMKSHIRLQLDDMAVIKFDPRLSLYKSLGELFGSNEETGNGGSEHRQSPLCAYGATDIEICGHGIIDGAGEHWRPFKRNNATTHEWRDRTSREGVMNAKEDRWYPMTPDEQEYARQRVGEETGQWKEYKDMVRPELLHFIRCSRIRLDGVTFQNSPMWNLRPELCDNITIKGCTVRNDHNAANGDGIDLESCRNVYLSRCVFDVGDDGICLKSGRDEAGRRRGVPTRDVIIDSCVVYHAHGGFVVGSEMSGGVRRVSVSDCLFMGTDNGLRFKSNRDRGGIVDSIFARNIYMERIKNEGILFDMYYFKPSEGRAFLKDMHNYKVSDVPTVDETTPTFCNIFIENITCAGADRAIYMDGLPERPIDGITISGFHATATNPSLISEGTNITLSGITITDKATGGSLYLHNTKGVDVSNDGGRTKIERFGSRK